MTKKMEVLRRRRKMTKRLVHHLSPRVARRERPQMMMTKATIWTGLSRRNQPAKSTRSLNVIAISSTQTASTLCLLKTLPPCSSRMPHLGWTLEAPLRPYPTRTRHLSSSSNGKCRAIAGWRIWTDLNIGQVANTRKRRGEITSLNLVPPLGKTEANGVGKFEKCILCFFLSITLSHIDCGIDVLFSYYLR